MSDRDEIDDNSEVVSGENSQLDDLYTRYRQRLRKSLFTSGLAIALITCTVSVIFCGLGVQRLMDLVMLPISVVLVALQFPAVLNSPLAALGFAILATVCLGAAATFVGGHVAPLPLFALILVRYNITTKLAKSLTPKCGKSEKSRGMNCMRNN
uniref:Uncharacterized protein n=2 Tax=Lutzomyia longipalpis TaxID=7200 RepID=A0A1B0EYW1_LUTLO